MEEEGEIQEEETKHRHYKYSLLYVLVDIVDTELILTCSSSSVVIVP